MPLDLLVPDLVPPPDAPAALRAIRMRALEKWLGRARIEESAACTAAEWLARAYGFESAPVAALSRLGEGAGAEGTWLRADPVHLRIEGDSLRLHGAAALEVTAEEAHALVDALGRHFAGDALEFHVGAPDRWYVRVASGVAPSTTPLDAAIGRDVFGLLPHNTAFNWRSALTEAQMIMGAHEVNARREESGRPMINSIWLWGGGALPAPPSSRPYALVHADDAFARGLALWSGAQARPLPASLAEVDLVPARDAALVVLDAFAAPLARGDAAAWQSAATRLDERWFAALGEAIERFDRVRIVIPSCGATRVATLEGAARWRWLRPPLRLSAGA